MKNNYTFKSLLSLLCFCMGFIMISAQTFEKNGINYEVIYENYVKVVANPGKYSGPITIPATVENEGTSYTVTEIGDSAFYGSTITSIDLNEGLTRIGERAFEASTLTSIQTPNSLTSIGSHAFRDNYNLISVTFNEGLTSIGDRSFASTGVTSIVIPSTITRIQDYTFSSSRLTTITLHENIVHIGQGAFFWTELTSVTIPSSVTNIGGSAFHACKSLASVTLNASITMLNYDVFRGCTSLKSIIIPNSVNHIGEGAFANTGLTSVIIPSSVTTIGTSAFENNNHLTSITLNEGLTTIGPNAFSSTKLRAITLPASVTSIGYSAFSNNYNLVNFTSLSTTPASLSEDVFYGGWQEYCDLTVPTEALASYQQAELWKDFYSINNPSIFEKEGVTYQILKETQTPDVRVITNPSPYTGIIEIPSSVSYKDTPYNVTKIGNRAFYNSEITSISLPSTINHIGDRAFFDSSNLTRFISLATTPPTLGDKSFGYTQNNYDKETTNNWQANSDLYVNNNSISTYKLAEQWKDFKSIQDLIILSTENIKLEKTSIYPNPAKDFVIVSNIKKGANINIYDFSGKLVHKTKANDTSIKINTSSLNNGLYLINVDGQTSKLMIAK